MPRQWTITGTVTRGSSRRPARELRVFALDVDGVCPGPLGEAITDARGRYAIRYGESAWRDARDTPPDVHVEVRGAGGRRLADTRRTAVRRWRLRQEIHVHVAEPVRRTLRIAGFDVGREAFDRLGADEFLALAHALIAGLWDDAGRARLHDLCPDVNPEGSLTPVVALLDAVRRRKSWSGDVKREFRKLLGPDAGTDSTFVCGPFRIEYASAGPTAPPPADVGGNIQMPGSGAFVGVVTGGNGVPDYIERLCFWLRRGLDAYTRPPLGLKDPTAGGASPVTVRVKSMAGGNAYAWKDKLHFSNAVSDDLLATQAVHELMHVVQLSGYGADQASLAGAWVNAMKEGGATFAEDAVQDPVNRYISLASDDGGAVKSPFVQLNSSMGYGASLLFKYISEQQSKRVLPADEPMIGVETYRALLEACHAYGYDTKTLAEVIEGLPWYQTFCRFKYLDEARLDRTSSETVLGNFWLALYLKDLNDKNPDRRFDFMEKGDAAPYGNFGVGSGAGVTAWTKVALTNDTTFTGDPNILGSGESAVNPFAAAFYKVAIDGGVDTFEVAFSALDTFDRPLVQIVLVEPGGVVRDILRSDRKGWTRRIANLRDGVRLDHVLIVVAGTDVGGKFTLQVTEADPAPDVMVTRWHHKEGTHYEIDSKDWAWTWVSPDLWVDNDGNGVADSVVRLGEDNDLFIRLHNQGRAPAADVGVEFSYQDASGGLSDAAWQPVRDENGAAQTLSGLVLAAGATGTFGVKWAPEPSGESKHFCIRAVVTCPGDPNTDNKRCLSNFGNVLARDLDLRGIGMMRHDPFGPPDPPVHRTDAVPRAFRRWVVDADDLARARGRGDGSGRSVFERFRVRRAAPDAPPPDDAPRRPERVPDPHGHYETDPRALPPGWAGVPMITLVQRRGSEVLGGFTWAIREP